MHKLTMRKLTVPAVILATLIIGFAPQAKADITSTIGEFDQPFSFVPGTTTLGDFTFTIPSGLSVGAATISGTFGNNDVPGVTNVTALSDYFVGNGAVEVAMCDNFTDPCSAGSVSGAPQPWSYTFTPADLSIRAPAFATGSLDLSVTQNFLGAVETGPITLDIQATPEPASYFLLCALCLAGLGLRRHLRKA
jgi:hypothetical protein